MLPGLPHTRLTSSWTCTGRWPRADGTENPPPAVQAWDTGALSSCEGHGEAKGQIPGPSILSWGLREELGI